MMMKVRITKRRIVWSLAALVALVAAAAGLVMGPFLLRVRHFEASPASGYHADFYLYVSPQAKRIARSGTSATLLVQPNNSGINSDDPEVHRKDAWWTCFGRHGLADELGVVLLVPAFPRSATDWRIYTHALDRDVFTTAAATRPDLHRLDLQLMAMVDAARAALAAEGLAIDARILIQGFSASGMFANRFAALHPSRVKAVAAGAPGGWPVAPVAEHAGEALPYPAGLADIEQLIGQPFDVESYRAMPQLIVMGALDDNDSLDFTDGWDKPAAQQVDRLFGADPRSRWDDARAIHQAAGANARFVLVDGVGHDRRKLQHLTTEFFARVMTR